MEAFEQSNVDLSSVSFADLWPPFFGGPSLPISWRTTVCDDMIVNIAIPFHVSTMLIEHAYLPSSATISHFSLQKDKY